jgi:hypothetical protein
VNVKQELNPIVAIAMDLVKRDIDNACLILGLSHGETFLAAFGRAGSRSHISPKNLLHVYRIKTSESLDLFSNFKKKQSCPKLK